MEHHIATSSIYLLCAHAFSHSVTASIYSQFKGYFCLFIVFYFIFAFFTNRTKYMISAMFTQVVNVPVRMAVHL